MCLLHEGHINWWPGRLIPSETTSKKAPDLSCLKGRWHYPIDKSLTTDFGITYTLDRDLASG